MHYAVHHQTAAEIVYNRVDNERPKKKLYLCKILKLNLYGRKTHNNQWRQPTDERTQGQVGSFDNHISALLATERLRYGQANRIQRQLRKLYQQPESGLVGMFSRAARGLPAVYQYRRPVCTFRLLRTV